MSWGLQTPCYGCLRSECKDMKKIEQAVFDIHQDPNHGPKGGAGNIKIECFKKEQAPAEERELV